jgi:hypothetical protein
MAGTQWGQEQDQQPLAGGAYTSGGPPTTGSTYGQYTPQTFAQQNQQTQFGAQSQAAGWPTPQQTAQPQQSAQSAQPQSWASQTANWQQTQPQYQPPAQQGYTAQGYSQPNQAYVQPQTAAPFGGWNQQPAAQAPAAGGSAAQQIQAAYQQYLGRSATPQEIAAQLAQPNLQRQIASIASSQEAYNRYQQLQQQPQQQQGGQGASSGRQGTVQTRPDARNWNTDGFTPPRYIAPKYAPHPMPGWDRAKWNDPNHQTPKYVIGRLLSGLKPRTANMDQAVALIAQAYPGTRRTGSGDITIPGIGSTDILQAADVGGKAWHFGGQGGGAQQPQQPQQGGYDPYAQLGQVLQNYTAQAPQAAVPAVDPGQAQQIAEMQQQLQMFQQQQATQQQQQAAAEAAARNRGPQFSYF